ncbi:MAG: hypothetical protein EB078_07310, partial [Proteobacteria bacterium]|nr:hypothetical protein [Pseudomonadota bacterium]
KKTDSSGESAEQEESEKKIIQPKRYKKKNPVSIPKDEGILLGRAPTFSYGLVAGGQLDLMTVDSDGSSISGNGYTIGGSLSFLLDPSFRLRTEVAYTSHGGVNDVNRLAIINFLDISAMGELPLGPSFYAFAGFQYSLGIGIDNQEGAIPSAALTDASEASGPWAQAGLGYKFSVGEMSFLSIRLRYAGAIVTNPIAFHTFGAQAVWEIEG